MDKNSEIRKKTIQEFIRIKKENPNTFISRELFLKNSGLPKRKMEEIFGSFTELKKEGELAYYNSLNIKGRALLSEITKKYESDATKEDVIDDLRKLQEENFGIHITRDFYRINGRYSDSTWSRFFGTFQELRRQAGLELTRQQHKLEVQIAKHASIDHYRDFFKSEVLPYYEKYTKPTNHQKIKTILAMSDLHDKECCEFSLSVFLDTCRRKQPDVIVLNGDIYDLLEFGKYSIDPRHYNILERFNFVRERVFKPLRNFCPSAQIDMIAGNHEMRLLKLMADATPNIRILLSDVMNIGFAEVFGLNDFQINWASKFDLGAYSNSDIRNECKKNYRTYFNTFIFTHIPDARLKNMHGSNGHHHKGLIESHSYIDPSTNLVKQVTWSQTPAMHVKDAEYLSHTSGWNTGFLEVTINIELCEAIQKIHFTNNNWCVVDGMYYEK